MEPAGFDDTAGLRASESLRSVGAPPGGRAPLSGACTRARRLAPAALLVALSVGCALRFHELGHDGLWSDELFTASMVQQHPLTPELASFRRSTVFEILPQDTFWTAKGAEQSPPLFELLTKAAVSLLGPSEFAFRVVSALAACLWLAFLALRALALRAGDRLLRRAYVVALVVGALSVPLVEYAQEGRAYGLGALFAGILATRWLERWYAGFASAALPGYGELGLFVLGCHAHYNVLVFSALLLTTYGVAALRTGRRRELARLALVPLACVPWVALNAHTILFTSGGGVRWRDIGVTEALAGAFRRVAELPGTPLLALAGAAVAVLVVRRARGLPAGGAAAWRALAALVVLAAVYVVAVAMVTMRAGMMHPRYYLFLLPALHVGLALLVALALERAAVVALALALFAGASAGRLGAYYAQDREGYREATRWLREHLRGDAPLVYTWGPNLPIYRFYLETSFGPDADDRAIRVSAEQEGGAVCERLGDAPKAGLIAHATHRHLAEAALAACGDRYRLAHELEIRGVLGQVWVVR